MAKHGGGGNGKFFSLDKGVWLIIGGLGGVALYLALIGHNTGIKAIDMPIRGVSNTIGITGIAKDYLPDVLTSEEKHAMFAEDGDDGDTDITVA